MQNYFKYKTFPRDATLLIGSTITAMAAAIIAPALPQMNVVFQDTPNAVFLVRLSLSIHALAIAMSAPFLGMLLDKWGRRPIVISSLILFGLSGASGFVAGSIYTILAGRSLLGVGMAGLMAGFTTLISDYFKGARLNKIMGLLQAAFMAFGSVFFLIVAGILADLGWRFPFLIYLFGFLILPGVLFFVDEPVIQKTNKEEGAKESLPIKKVGPVYLLAFTGMAIMFILPLHLPFHLKALYDTSNTKIGLALGASMLFCVCGFYCFIQGERTRHRGADNLHFGQPIFRPCFQRANGRANGDRRMFCCCRSTWCGDSGGDDACKA